MCEWGAMRDERDAEVVAGGGTALRGTGPEDVEAMLLRNAAARTTI